MRDEEVKHRDLDLAMIVKAVCARPKMHVGYENFRLVAAFIGGFAYASDVYFEEALEFNVWVAVKLGFPRNWVWSYTIEQKYPNDEDALRELPKLFEEFKNSKEISHRDKGINSDEKFD